MNVSLCEDHKKPENIICNTCKKVICSKCQSISHRLHDICVDIDEAYDEIIGFDKFNYVKDNREIESKTSIKKAKLDEDYGNSERLNQKLEEEVALYFRNLHDSLHYKEVEIKRELASYRNDNFEKYTMEVTKIEEYAGLLKKFLANVDRENSSDEVKLETIRSIFNINSIKKENNTNYIDRNNEEIIYMNCSLPKQRFEQVEENVQCLGLNLDSKDTPTLTDQISPLLTKYSTTIPFNTQNNNNITVRHANIIPNMELVGLKPEIQLQNGNGCQIITFGLHGVERYTNLEKHGAKNYLQIKLDPTSKQPVVSAYENYFFHNSSSGGKIFLFCNSEYWEIDTDSEKPSWTSYPCPINGSCPSTIFDGNELIYIFGGYSTTNKEAIKTVYTFNINKKELTLLGEKMLINAAYLNLSLSYEQNKPDRIYLMGGFNNSSNWLERIDYFDLKSKEVYPVCITKTLGIAAINCACMVSSLNSVYIFAIEYSFHRYDIERKSIHKLTPPDTKERGRSKLFYDGDDKIFLVTCGNGQRPISEYSIKNDTWRSTQRHLNSLKSGEFVSFSQ